jgi:nitrite reductase/ring-hydroxylating ferredoxin subunit
MWRCAVDAIPDPGARGFVIHSPRGPLAILVARRGPEVFAYFNVCPHTGVNLDWVPDRFLDVTSRFLQCATHGALFRLQDGFCIDGPCAGRSLRAVPLSAAGGQVEIDADSL